jgi:DNA-binding beta-propeller fold protein YncE
VTPLGCRGLNLYQFFAARSIARPMAFYVLFVLLALSTGLTVSPTTSPSPTPTPCSASPGYFCSDGSALICPIGAYCAGGSALYVSCYPATACTVAGLSAQPPCFWKASTLAGNGTSCAVDGSPTTSCFFQPNGIALNATSGDVIVSESGCLRAVRIEDGWVTTIAGKCSSSSWLDGIGTAASFTRLIGIDFAASGDLYGADSCRIRRVSPSLNVTTLAGGICGFLDNAVGTSARFSANTRGLSVNSSNFIYVSDQQNQRIRTISPIGLVGTLTGFLSNGSMDGTLATASLLNPTGLALDHLGHVVFGEQGSNNIRSASFSAVVTIAGCSAPSGFSDGYNFSACFTLPYGIAYDPNNRVIWIADTFNNNVRTLSAIGQVASIAAGTTGGFSDGFFPLIRFTSPRGIATAINGVIFVLDAGNFRVRQLTCVPCPASYYCFSGAPVLCPAGSFCPLSSINAMPCPMGSFSTAGASNCTPCFAGTFASSTGSTSCHQCPGGHYCPSGTSSWARLNCGRGNYCPDGSGAPTPCPYQVPPSGGWGALQVQGPAFLVETANCLNHCFWNFTSGDGVLSKC